jgi:hypothetical protein
LVPLEVTIGPPKAMDSIEKRREIIMLIVTHHHQKPLDFGWNKILLVFSKTHSY